MGTSENATSYRLSSLDDFENLNYLDTSQVTDMSYLFAYCGASTLNVSSFNTTKVTDMTMMFGNNANLESLDLSHFDVTQVQSMRQLVSYNRQLKKILMPSSVSSSLKDLKRMFIGNRLLTELELSKINTAKVSNSNLNEMLSGMTGLKNLVLGPQSYLNESVDLPEIQKSDNYTGNWVKTDDLAINMGASLNFVKNYN